MSQWNLSTVRSALRRLHGTDIFDCVDAVSVGGSVGRGNSDEYSDLDLFVIAANSALGRFNEIAIGIMGTLTSEPCLRRGPVEVPQFGHSFTFVTSDLDVVQINLSSWAAFHVSAMSLDMKIVIDRDRKLFQLLNNADVESIDSGSWLWEQSTYFWIRTLFCARSLLRGQYWRSIDYLHDLSRCMLQILWFREGHLDKWATLSSPTVKVEEILGIEAVYEVGVSRCLYGPNDITAALKNSVAWFEEVYSSLEAEAPFANPESEAVAKIRTLVREL